MKKKTKTVRAAQLPTEIETLASENTDDAILLATRGETFSELESQIEHYFWTLGEWAKVSNGKPSSGRLLLGDNMPDTPAKEFEWFKNSLERQTSGLSERFVDALDRRDTNKIREFADAIERVKNFKPTRQDRLRLDVLSLKQTFDRAGRKIEIRDLAKLVGIPLNQIEHLSVAGFSKLRRLAKRLNFPLAESRKGRRKKPTSNS